LPHTQILLPRGMPHGCMQSSGLGRGSTQRRLVQPPKGRPTAAEADAGRAAGEVRGEAQVLLVQAGVCAVLQHIEAAACVQAHCPLRHQKAVVNIDHTQRGRRCSVIPGARIEDTRSAQPWGFTATP
jgi:hypothetical protein